MSSAAAIALDRIEVPFFDGSLSHARYRPRFEQLIDEILADGKVSHGIIVKRFEQAIRERTGAEAALGVNSGTDALILLLRAAGIGPGDEVIVPCFTFFASASSVALVGATPIFVDIDAETYTLDPAAFEEAVTPRTKAVMPVHLFTQMADMDAIAAVAAQAGIAVLEDSAEAIGMRWRGTHAGLVGRGGVLSFFPTKTLGGLGDSGMVLTDDGDLAAKVQLMRHHGRTGRTVGHLPGISHEAVLVGTNSKMDELQAAYLLARLEFLDEEIERREMLAALYDAQLAPLSEHVRRPVIRRSDHANPVYYTYVMEAERRDGLVKWLDAAGIRTEIYYPQPLHLQPCFACLGHAAGDFPVAEAASRRTLALPFYPDLEPKQISHICRVIGEFYRRGRGL